MANCHFNPVAVQHKTLRSPRKGITLPGRVHIVRLERIHWLCKAPPCPPRGEPVLCSATFSAVSQLTRCAARKQKSVFRCDGARERWTQPLLLWKTGCISSVHQWTARLDKDLHHISNLKTQCGRSLFCKWGNMPSRPASSDFTDFYSYSLQPPMMPSETVPCTAALYFCLLSWHSSFPMSHKNSLSRRNMNLNNMRIIHGRITSFRWRCRYISSLLFWGGFLLFFYVYNFFYVYHFFMFWR